MNPWKTPFWKIGNGLRAMPVKSRLKGKVSRRVGIVDEGELVREHLLADLVFAQEGKTAFHRAAVETDPVHKIEHVGDGGGAKDDIVAAQRDLLGGVGLVMLDQEGQLLPQG